MRRPSIAYSDAIANRICAELGRGRTLTEICGDDGMPTRAKVHGWVSENLHGFGERYRDVAHRRGRPSRYSRDVAERICDALRAGRTLTDICDDAGLPSVRAVGQWMRTDRDGFAARFREARDIGYLAIADEILDIADDARNDWMARRAAKAFSSEACPRTLDPGVDTGSREENASRQKHLLFDRENVARSRLRITARCWLLSRMLPRMFGRRVGVEAVHEAGDSLREVMKLIDGRTRGLPSADAAPAHDADGAPRRCPCCGGVLPAR